MTDEEINTILKENCADIFMLKVLIDETRVNPNVLFHIINAITSVIHDTNWGVIHLQIRQGEIKQIDGEHQNRINLKAIQ